MHAAYWHKDGIDIYNLSHAEARKIASGQIEELKPVKAFGKKILIAGRENLIHVRKRYPIINEKDIEKAISMEADEIFPMPRPSFCFRVFERTKMYTLVDIWAWDSSSAGRISSVFNFTHIMPEDLAFAFDKSEIVAYGFKDAVYITAHGGGKFLGASSFAGSVDDKDVEFFIRSLGGSASGLKALRLYGRRVFDLKLSGPQLKQLGAGIEIIKEKEKAYPICLDNIGGLELKPFRLRQAEIYSLNAETVLKAAVYIILGYAISLFFSIRNYDGSIKMLDNKIFELSKKQSASMDAKNKEGYAQVLSLLKERLGLRASPLDVMEVFAASLPEKTFLIRLVINEKNVHAYITSNEPLNVINALSIEKRIKSVKVKGAPFKDRNTGSYNFTLEVEI